MARWTFPESGRTDGEEETAAVNVERMLQIPPPLRLLHPPQAGEPPLPHQPLPRLLLLRQHGEQHQRLHPRKRPVAVAEVSVAEVAEVAEVSAARLHCRQTAFLLQASAMPAGICRETCPSSRGPKS
jgi:hypothetical protein